jgi:hypothetical protein
MKKVFILFFAFSLIILSCGKKPAEGTHVHDDGAVHADHATDTTKQEEFAAGDTTATDTTKHDHEHH